MAEPFHNDNVLPCLLDRLTDHEPLNPNESRTQRMISRRDYVRGVIRDIGWLLNSYAFLDDPHEGGIALKNFPHASRSVLNYGARQLCGLTAPDMERLRRELTEAFRTFEPRIKNLKVGPGLDRHLVELEIEGQLWANPVPEQLNLTTEVDLENSQWQIGEDGAHG